MSATIHLDVLRDIRIASPCPAAWEDMKGDNKKRHCSQCDLDVHNLEQMTRTEIEALVATANGRLCVQLFRRHDGTILTKDCPVGLAALRAKTRRTAARVVAFASVLFSATVLLAMGQSNAREKAKLVSYQPFRWAHERLSPTPPPGPPPPSFPTGRMSGSVMMGSASMTPAPSVSASSRAALIKAIEERYKLTSKNSAPPTP